MIQAVLLLLLGVIIILAIIAANAFFVAQEFAYMSVDRSRLRAQAAAGDQAAQQALDVTSRTSFMLSGAQLGITVTGLLVGYVAEPLVGSSIGTLLEGVNVPQAVGISIGTVGALVLSTVVQMIFGELYPKNLAIASPEPLARRLAGPTTIYLKGVGWLIRFFDLSSNALLRLFRIEPVHDLDSSATAEDLEYIVADSRETGDLPDEIFTLLDRILDFPNEDVEHALIPRTRVDVVRAEATVGEIRELMSAAHTRYPVVDETDQVIGMVQLMEVLDPALPDEAPVTEIMKEPLILSEYMALPDALAELNKSRNELACVVDEYGGFAGILTVEDIAEELVGELTDEHDPEQPESLTPVSDREWVMSGDVHVDEAERAIGSDLPEGDYETIAGLVIALHGELPEEGETVEIPLAPDPAELINDEPTRRWLTATVVEVERHVPSQLRVELHEAPEAASAGSPSSNGDDSRSVKEAGHE